MQQPLDAGTEIDERAEVAHGSDATGQHRSGNNGSPHFVRARALLLLQQRTPRDDDAPPRILVFDDPELVDASFVNRRVRSTRIDLRERAERALAADAHLEPALHDPFD